MHLANYLQGLNDPNVLATVHYYSTDLYAFTTNLGVSIFDETYNWTSAKNVADDFYNCLNQAFVQKGIGVVVGEYGLFNMGYKNALEDGEVVKFIDYMNRKARSLGICLMLWDCGNIIDRSSGNYINSTWGDAIQTSMTSNCSYATGLDELFVTESQIGNDIQVPLTLNGNSLTGIYNGGGQLSEGVDYTYANDTVTLKGSYISGLSRNSYGRIADLQFKFSNGYTWHEYINYVGEDPVLNTAEGNLRADDGYHSHYDTDGTATYPTFIISGDFKGHKVRRICSRNSSGNVVSSNTWASIYMQLGGEFIADYNSSELLLLNWYTNSIGDGTYTLTIDFYDGTSMQYSLTKQGSYLSGHPM